VALLMAALPAMSQHAALVCSVWRRGWQGTSALRGLCPATCPSHTFIEPPLLLAPISHELLCVSYNNPSHSNAAQQHALLDGGMRRLHDIHIDLPTPNASMLIGAASTVGSETSLYVWEEDTTTLLRFQLNDDGSTGMRARKDDVGSTAIYSVTPHAPGGVVFASAFGDGREEVIALDALTLEFRFSFGSEILCDVRNSAVAGTELFVCDRYLKFDEDGDEIEEVAYGRLIVFSLTGEYHREIRCKNRTGWHVVDRLCHVSGRLYFVEFDGRRTADDRSRIISVTPEGEQLQAFNLASTQYFPDMCLVKDQFLVWGKDSRKPVTFSAVQVIA